MATRSREKTARRRENADKRPHATAKYIRVSTRKAKADVDLIRGKSVREAQAILQYTPKGATEPVAKVLNSAIARFIHRHRKDSRQVPGDFVPSRVPGDYPFPWQRCWSLFRDTVSSIRPGPIRKI